MQPGSMAGIMRRYADLLEVEMAQRLEQLGEGQVVEFTETIYDILVSI